MQSTGLEDSTSVIRPRMAAATQTGNFYNSSRCLGSGPARRDPWMRISLSLSVAVGHLGSSDAPTGMSLAVFPISLPGRTHTCHVKRLPDRASRCCRTHALLSDFFCLKRLLSGHCLGTPMWRRRDDAPRLSHISIIIIVSCFSLYSGIRYPG